MGTVKRKNVKRKENTETMSLKMQILTLWWNEKAYEKVCLWQF